MIDPAALAARNPRPSANSAAHWALNLLPLLYSPRGMPGRWNPPQMATLDPVVLARLRGRGIGGRVEHYGANLRRFELDLERALEGPARFPLVTVPSTAMIDWRTGGLQVRSRTFIVAYEHGEPVFVSREPRSRTLVKITLKQMRILHRTWQRWPVILPSMLFTVLWHWPLAD